MAKQFTFVDFFCGCGGASCGLEQAGWKSVAAIDVDSKACDTYATNFPDARVICDDVRSEAVQAALKDLTVDVVFGSPPCQGFSKRNTQTQLAKYTEMNTLPLFFLKLATSLSPRAIFMEEVPNVKRLLPDFERILGQHDYIIAYADVLDASLYGVPQKRKRFILVAIREDAMAFTSPVPSASPMTAGDGLERVPVPTMGKVLPTRAVVRIKEFNEQGRRSGQYAVMDMRKPARTIHTQSLSSTGPYTIKRDDTYHEMSLQEAARLQSFPDSFTFKGSSTSVRKQIGNAVPPELARRVAIGFSIDSSL